MSGGVLAGLGLLHHVRRPSGEGATDLSQPAPGPPVFWSRFCRSNFFSLPLPPGQDEKNQMMTTNVWLKQVRVPPGEGEGQGQCFSSDGPASSPPWLPLRVHAFVHMLQHDSSREETASLRRPFSTRRRCFSAHARKQTGPWSRRAGCSPSAASKVAFLDGSGYYFNCHKPP